MEGNTGESPKTSSINNIPRTTSPTNTATKGFARAQQIETLLIHNIALHALAIIQKREKTLLVKMVASLVDIFPQFSQRQ